MKSTDHRNANWQAIQARLSGLRLATYHAVRVHGPGTTRELADRSGIDLLSLRPRITELLQLGFVEILPERQGHEGCYRAVPLDEARRRHFSEPEEPHQLPLL